MQQPLPAKWKSFRIISYLHMCGLMVMLVNNLYVFFVYRLNEKGLLNLSLALFLFAVLMGNCIIGLTLLDKYYPDKLPSWRLPAVNAIIHSLAWIIVSIASLTFLVTLYMLLSQQRETNIFSIFGATLLGTLGFTGVYVCWLQPVLKKTILSNYKQAMDSFLVTDN